MDTSRHLDFGYNRGVPERVTAAWGCRAIVTQDGSVDVPPDRTGAFGPEDELAALFAELDTRVGSQWRDRATGLLCAGLMNTRIQAEHVLFNDGVVIVKGNTNASAGYLYVCAYRAGPGEMP